LSEFGKELLEMLHKKGISRGLKIAELARQLHPKALVIVPLYRSCLVVEQTEEQQKEGVCTLHFYWDPGWQGLELNLDNLRKFHSVAYLHGQRSGPDLVFPSEDGNAYACLPTSGTFELLESDLKEEEKPLYILRKKKEASE